MRAHVPSHSVSVSEDDLAEFRSRWPASGLHGLRGVTFQFDRGGDLVDVRYKNGDSDRWDGPALSALSQDAQAYLERVTKPKGAMGFTYLSHNHYRVSDADAGRLAKDAGKTLPRPGYEMRVQLPAIIAGTDHPIGGKMAWLLRTPLSHGKDAPKRGWVWAVHV